MHCPKCKTGSLIESAYVREFFPGRQRVAVELLQSICDCCAHTRTLSKQHDENLRRLAARKAQYGPYCMTEEYIRFRKRYGLSRALVAGMLGISTRTYRRYENEEAYPRGAAQLLIRLALSKPDIAVFLAGTAGFVLPLAPVQG